MTNNELLLAMSDMMETKLKAEVRPLRNEMYDMEQRLESKVLGVKDELQHEIREVKVELRNEIREVQQNLEGKIQNLDSKIQDVEQSLEGKIQNLDSKIQSVEQNLNSKIQNLDSKIQNVEQSLGSQIQEVQQNLGKEIHLLKLCQENLILPLLNTIESCYTDTYRRYRDYADRIEAVFDDVDIMKKVITEHSRELQKLA